jgi:hypothetical protein
MRRIMKTIIYSDNKNYYYVKELAMPRDFWLSSRKYTVQPEPTGWISDIMQFDNLYFRVILYFTFWKVRNRNKIQESVSDDNELVRDYQDVQNHMRK